MSTWIKAALALSAVAACAQDSPLDPRSSFKINFPKDSPITVVEFDLGRSNASVRGGAMTIDLHSNLLLRNSSGKRIRGVTLLVLTQDFTPGGRGSVASPSLDVPPGENFPVRIDLRMLRPLAASGGALVQVSLDGVLFDDLSFIGDNRLNSRRSLTIWELEARRDRKHFKQLLEAEGPTGLEKGMLAAIARQTQRPRLDVQISRRGTLPRAANAPATTYEPAHSVQFAALHLPEAPVEVLGGTATVAGNEARAPSLHIENLQAKPVRYLELGWAVRDREGREFLAGTVPADVQLAGLGRARVLDEAALRISNHTGGRPVLESMLGFVHVVEFADGQLWIPTRAAVEDARLGRLIPPSPEEQRLGEIYQKRGLRALMDDLRK